MSRRTPAPGSRTSRDCGRGITGNFDTRTRRAVAKMELDTQTENRLVESLPRIVFDDQGVGYFKPETRDQVDGLRLAAERFDWEVHDGFVICRVKLFHYNKRQHDATCRLLVPKLYFQGTPTGMMAICNNEKRSDDLRHGLDLEAQRYGWTVNHKHVMSYVHKPYHAKPMKKAA